VDWIGTQTNFHFNPPLQLHAVWQELYEENTLKSGGSAKQQKPNHTTSGLGDGVLCCHGKKCGVLAASFTYRQ
jgi:hypothetical protein